MTLRIYDLSGRLVRTLFAGAAAEGGAVSAAWDGRSARGGMVGRGRYFVRLTWPGGTETEPFTFLGPE